MKIRKDFGDAIIVDCLDKEQRSAAKPVSVQVNLNKWSDFSQLRERLRGRGWVYRGQEDAEWELATGIEREKQILQSVVADSAYVRGWSGISPVLESFTLAMAKSLMIVGSNLPNEMMAIDNFRKLTRGKLECGDSYIECLAAMQHYGSKTRLLDFTHSIYVALFFAFEKRFTGKSRAIWAVRLDRLLSNVKRDIIGTVRKVKKGAMSMDQTACAQLLQDSVQVRDDIMRLADKVIKSKATPKLGVLPVQILGNNPRMDAQNGLFMMPCNFEPFMKNLAKSLGIETHEAEVPSLRVESGDVSQSKVLDDAVLAKIVFGQEMERDAWNVLEEANITPRTIYPDLEGIAKSMRYGVEYV